MGAATPILERSSPTAADAGPGPSVARATAIVSLLNLLSRITGLGRVVAMSAALGATALGDTYQAANLTSNILFELLAGGVLSAALVPTFVALFDKGRHEEAVRLAGVLLGAMLAALSLVVALALVLAPQLMGVLSMGVADTALRNEQNALGTFLLWFFLPQILLYAVGAVATALLHADRRFVAAALAPVFNNLVVIASMLVFWSIHDGAPGFDLTAGERVVLGAGATLGVVAMTIVPLIASWRGGLALRPRWAPAEPAIRPLIAKGTWAAGNLGLFQALALITLIVANEVAGGVVAYHMAFTIFLLPYALLANPLTTTLYPILAASAAADRSDRMAHEVGWGMRTLAFVLIPASFIGAAVARPALEFMRLGNLDADGAGLVSAATGGYMAGLLGYAAFLLLTRAFYALGDTRTPTVVNLVTVASGCVAALILGQVLAGTSVLVMLGLVHAAVVTVGAIGLWWIVQRRVGRIDIAGAIGRDVAMAALAGMASWSAVASVGTDSRWTAALAVAFGGTAGVLVYFVGHALIGADELRQLRSSFGRRP